MPARPTRPRHDYAGPYKWACDHAARLQNTVGDIRDGIVITSIKPRRYYESWRRWGVEEEFQYIGQGHLGKYYHFLMLPL